MSEIERNVEAALARQKDLPAYLRRDEETIRADEQAQALKRASFTRSKLTEAERMLARGSQLEEIAASNLPLTRDEEEMRFESARLAEGLELQGRFAEAADAHPDDEEKARLQTVVEAVERDDTEHCGCEPEKVEVGGQTIEVHPHYEVKRIYSRQHGKMVSLVGCTRCEHLNATPVLPEGLARVLGAQGSKVPDAHVMRVG